MISLDTAKERQRVLNLIYVGEAAVLQCLEGLAPMFLEALLRDSTPYPVVMLMGQLSLCRSVRMEKLLPEGRPAAEAAWGVVIEELSGDTYEVPDTMLTEQRIGSVVVQELRATVVIPRKA